MAAKKKAAAKKAAAKKPAAKKAAGKYNDLPAAVEADLKKIKAKKAALKKTRKPREKKPPVTHSPASRGSVLTREYRTVSEGSKFIEGKRIDMGSCYHIHGTSDGIKVIQIEMKPRIGSKYKLVKGEQGNTLERT